MSTLTDESKELLLSLCKKMDEIVWDLSSDDSNAERAAVFSFRMLAKELKLKAIAFPDPQIQDLVENLSLDFDCSNFYAAIETHTDFLIVSRLIEERLPLIDEFHTYTLDSFLAPPLLKRLKEAVADDDRLTCLHAYCLELNGSYRAQYFTASLLLLRTILNYVPPFFGENTFDAVVAQARLSEKKIFEQLKAMRPYANLEAHKTAEVTWHPPSALQVEPYKAALETLLNAVLQQISFSKKRSSDELGPAQ
jgi:hypothetical protein